MKDRLAEQPDEWIDRAQELQFDFEDNIIEQIALAVLGVGAV